MRNLLLALLLSAPAAAQWTPELMMTVRRVGDVSVAPDGRAVYTVARADMEGEKSEWAAQLWVDGHLLTAGRSAQWSPDAKQIAFLLRKNGRDNIWLIAPDGGEATQLTDEKGGVLDFAWSPAGDRIAFRSAEGKSAEEERAAREKRDFRAVGEAPRFANLWVIGLADRQSRRQTSQTQVMGYDWSPDGKNLVYSHQRLPGLDAWGTADLALLDVASGVSRMLLDSPAAEGDPSWSPDGRTIACTISDNPPKWGFANRVHLVSPAGGTPRPLALTPDNESNILGWLGNRVVVAEAYRTVNRVYALTEGECQPLTPADRMVDGPILTGEWLGFTSQSPADPPEAFVTRAEAFEPKQVSRVQPTLPPTGKTEVLTWKAPDGTPVDGLFTAGKTARAPLLLIIHGGPSGVYQQSYLGTASIYPVAVFHDQGYAVLRCNVRGSSGYGKAFRFANYRDWGGGDYQDLLAGVETVLASGAVDPERMGVMGWSYGGALSCWITTQTSRFKAASVGAGVIDLVSMTGTTDVPSFIPDYFGGEFWDQGPLWAARSPLNHIKSARTPTLIQHGESDARVPIGQGYELYNALKRQGVPVRMMVYPRQGHGFTEPKMTLAGARHNLEWFARYVKGGP